MRMAGYEYQIGTFIVTPIWLWMRSVQKRPSPEDKFTPRWIKPSHYVRRFKHRRCKFGVLRVVDLLERASPCRDLPSVLQQLHRMDSREMGNTTVLQRSGKCAAEVGLRSVMKLPPPDALDTLAVSAMTGVGVSPLIKDSVDPGSYLVTYPTNSYD